MSNKYDCFTGKAEMYASSWPQFGDKYFQLIENYVNKAGLSIAYDIACGTGLHTKTIFPLFKKIYAIDPNLDMLNECRNYLRDCKNIEFYNSEAENLTKINEKADVIFVAQAFNLLNHNRVKLSFREKLNENGLIVLTWNSKAECTLFKDLSKISSKYCPLYENKCYKYKYKFNTFNYFFERHPAFYKFSSDVPMYLNKDIFLFRCLSTSYAITKDNENFAKYIRELENLFDYYQEDGKIYYPLDTVVYIGEIR